jgi:hypothetical protein
MTFYVAFKSAHDHPASILVTCDEMLVKAGDYLFYIDDQLKTIIPREGVLYIATRKESDSGQQTDLPETAAAV